MAEAQHEIQHETHLISAKPIFVVLGSVVVFLLISLTVLYLVYRQQPREEPSPQRMQFDSASQVGFDEIQREKQARLESYGWVDEQHGIAHIPIEQAMQLVLEHYQRQSQLTDQAGGTAMSGQTGEQP